MIEVILSKNPEYGYIKSQSGRFCVVDLGLLVLDSYLLTGSAFEHEHDVLAHLESLPSLSGWTPWMTFNTYMARAIDEAIRTESSCRCSIFIDNEDDEVVEIVKAEFKVDESQVYTLQSGRLNNDCDDEVIFARLSRIISNTTALAF